MSEQELKTDIVNLPVMDKITIEIAGQSYPVAIPFEFKFWVWIFKNFLFNDPKTLKAINDNKIEITTTDEQYGENIATNIHKIIMELTGVDANIVLETQTETESVNAQIAIFKQMNWEREHRPLVFNKAMMAAAQICQIRQKPVGKS